jgi:fermentation-respiration switch protein FrsA (DUF1100 family)
MAVFVSALLFAGFVWSLPGGVSVIPTPLIHNFLYFPERDLVATPADIGLVYEDVYVTTADGIVVHGWYLPRLNAVATLYFLHGNAGNISHRVAMLHQLHQAGFQVFILDYRGYGLSQGSPSEFGTYQDALAGWRWLQKRKETTTPLILYGRSLGGTVAAWLAVQEEVKPDGIVLESTFTRLRDMATVAFALPGLGKFMPDLYPTIDRVREISCPLLFIHGEADEVVPVSHVYRLFEAAVAPKSLYLIPQAHHNDTLLVGGSTYLERLRRFAQEVSETMP